MNPQSIIDGMQRKNRDLSAKNDELPELAENMAQAEREFNVAYARKLLELKAGGASVTLSKDLAKGDKGVADLLFSYRVSEAIYDAAKKKIHSLTISIDTYRSLLSWAKSEKEHTV